MMKMNTLGSNLTKNTSMYSVKKTNYSMSKSASSHHVIQSNNRTKCWPPHGLEQGLRKSYSTNCVIETTRGFKPSDVRDPNKREFLTNLTHKIWKFGPVRI